LGSTAHARSKPASIPNFTTCAAKSPAIGTVREATPASPQPNSSVAGVFDCYRVLGELEAQLVR
jgi:hypothetical protein